MNRIMVLMSILMSLCLLMIIGCGGEPDDADVNVAQGTVIRFEPEYDYITGYDISSYFNGAKGTFEECNTDFWPYQDEDSEIPDADTVGYIYSPTDVMAFASKHADCELDDNGLCAWFEHKLYLAAVKRYVDNQTLGATINDGIQGQAMCMVFVEYIREYAPTTGYSTDQITEGTLLHELGHGRANLTHFCNGTIIDSDNHSGNTCLMINNLPKYGCTDVSPLDGYHPYSFCDKCINELKAVTW